MNFKRQAQEMLDSGLASRILATEAELHLEATRKQTNRECADALSRLDRAEGIADRCGGWKGYFDD